MNSVTITAAGYLLSLTFGAGGAYYMIKQSRKDVNGLGRKVNGEIRKSNSRHQNITLALMSLANSDEQRQYIAELLREKNEEDE
ncbi:MAG: hypothetical protein LAN84_00195 [Acidobacteriia bacterium]|nr:hypothetical protein [Terriglobia bacterium]